MKTNAILAALVVAFGVAMPAAAHEKQYSAILNGASENPVNDSLGTGSVLVTVDFDLLTMRIEATFSGLRANVSAAHIHCCIDVPKNIGVAVLSPSLTGFPTGVKAGVYDHTLDMSLGSSYSSGFLTANGGSISTAFGSLIAAFDNGAPGGPSTELRAYFNIHTMPDFPGGEIRGFLAPVPEPETYALMLAGLGLVGWAAARRRKVGV